MIWTDSNSLYLFLWDNFQKLDETDDKHIRQNFFKIEIPIDEKSQQS